MVPRVGAGREGLHGRLHPDPAGQEVLESPGRIVVSPVQEVGDPGLWKAVRQRLGPGPGLHQGGERRDPVAQGEA